jgi:hypothetical protein
MAALSTRYMTSQVEDLYAQSTHEISMGATAALFKVKQKRRLGLESSWCPFAMQGFRAEMGGAFPSL